MIKSNSNKENARKAVECATEKAIEYVSNIYDRRVYPSPDKLDELVKFDERLPEDGCDASSVIEMLHRYGSPATVASTGGRYYGLVVGGATPASMGASMLTTSWDQVAIMDSTAPSALYIERVASKWLLELLHLPRQSSVGLTTGTTMANLIALAAARNAQYTKLGVDISSVGLSGAPHLRIVLSEQAHITVYKALKLLGFGKNQFIKVPCDSQGRIIASNFPAVGADTIVCLQAGNVNSGASDPFNNIISKAKNNGAWVHIDGAFGLWANASKNKKHQTLGVENADSWAIDAHKWLNTPYDCGVAICKEPKLVHEVMATQAPYLTTSHIIPPKEMTLEFSRRARGVEVWAAIKEMGQKGISELIDQCCYYACQISDSLQNMGYEILNDVVLNQVVATIGTPEDIKKIIELVQNEGECWFGYTYWQGRHAFRLSISSWATTNDDINRTIGSIKRATSSVLIK